jgi:hypothetical protein
MNILTRWRFVLCVLALTSVLSAAEPVVPELRGMLATGTDRRFALSIPGGDTAWVSVGGKFAGWTLSEFRANEDALILLKDGKETRLKLSASKIAEADVQATLADADAVLTKMNFEVMFEKMMEQQKSTMLEMTRKLTGNPKGADAADAEAFQSKVMDVMFAEMKPEQMKADFAKIYSEVFTKSELKALGDFYGTAAGQAMVEKQPLVQKRTMEVMMPRMMAGMAKVGPMAAEFKKQQAEKKAAAAAAAAPAAAK